jgi:DNA-binding IclR family transcriptional regulator
MPARLIRFASRLDNIRSTGLASEFQESTRGITCVAGPEFGVDDRVVAPSRSPGG